MSAPRPFIDADRGCTRLVLLVGRWAIKAPNLLCGWRNAVWGLLGNMQEAAFAATGWPELCPVLWHIPGGFLLVMRRVRVMTDEEFAAFDALAFCDHPDRPVPAEAKSTSFGFLPDGRVVCVDYGT